MVLGATVSHMWHMELWLRTHWFSYLVLEWDSPAIPEILTPWFERSRQRLWAKHSETNEAEDASSRITHASTEEPSGVSTSTRHVISGEFNVKPMAVFDDTGFTVGCVEGCTVGAMFEGVTSFDSTCNNVWCGFWHLRHLWSDLHCLTKWDGFKQLIHRPLVFNRDDFVMCLRFEPGTGIKGMLVCLA